ncbi:hypothetical protein [Cedecea colo]|uniref:Uncharacterized protein n=1 Tax=Cedecea colo TaxID=2552946 RepID=A0ABX0VM90_9ENTR|nr:hypothetical protein [Cedecea colo]NIY47321.1 hypothetical protein [Cedecea colo]
MTNSLEALKRDVQATLYKLTGAFEPEHTSEKQRQALSDMFDTMQALIAALEQAQQRVDELDKLTAEQDQQLINYASIATKNAVKASESSQLSVKLPDYRNSPDMHTKQFYEAVGFNQGLDACIEAIRAAGGTVEGE